MTHIYDDPARFKEDVLNGFALAHGDHVQRVPGASGFIRRGGARAGKVALVVGGGSGHYPSYSGVTGTGFADGAVLGDVFTSPSAEQAYRVGRAAHGGAGVVFAFGNYAGDRMNFATAADRLRGEGTDVRIVYVTDDTASAEVADKDKRRGIAGTFTVYKMGGAAAERGDDLDAVEQVMRRANDRTFSFGVAFNGCTFPGQSAPLFHVAPNTMDFGLGIHGEPGVRTESWLPASELARFLVEPLLAERPEDGSRAAVLLNGLGATKYEELFVLWGYIHPLLEAAGVVLIAPEVGELVTSLDMAGCSLTITWLDDELEELWQAPAHTPAYRKGAAAQSTFEAYMSTDLGAIHADEETIPATPRSLDAASTVKALLHVAEDTVRHNEAELARIDAVAGDGDHGSGMVRGLGAAVAAADAADGGVRQVLRQAGGAFGDRAGGTSGVLWGVFLQRIGDVLDNGDDINRRTVAAAVRAGADQMRTLGKAELGDKTMLDAIYPFVDALDARVAAGDNLAAAWRQAAAVATSAAADTAQLSPKVGRARPLAERSVGTPDAGATSMALILTAAGEYLTKESARA